MRAERFCRHCFVTPAAAIAAMGRGPMIGSRTIALSGIRDDERSVTPAAAIAAMGRGPIIGSRTAALSGIRDDEHFVAPGAAVAAMARGPIACALLALVLLSPAAHAEDATPFKFTLGWYRYSDRTDGIDANLRH